MAKMEAELKIDIEEAKEKIIFLDGEVDKLMAKIKDLENALAKAGAVASNIRKQWTVRKEK